MRALFTPETGSRGKEKRKLTGTHTLRKNRKKTDWYTLLKVKKKI
jgi:hypothetical protein